MNATLFLNIISKLQAKALADPFAYDAYIEQRKKEKLEAERASRITVSECKISLLVCV